MRRRSLLACTPTFAAAAALLAGCTFLIDFEEAAPLEEGGPSADVQPPPMPDAEAEADAPADRDARDARDAIVDPDACSGQLDGKYCGGNQIPWPVELKDDLITCKTGQVASVRYCATGQGCVAMLDGYPDECDDCIQKPDGTYCGRDLAGWGAGNENQRIRCQSGRVVGLLLCNTCVSNGGASTCQ